MLLGCKNYFSFFGLLLFSVNVTLSALISKFENFRDHTTIMIEAFLHKVLRLPRRIQYKTKKGNH